MICIYTYAYYVITYIMVPPLSYTSVSQHLPDGQTRFSSKKIPGNFPSFFSWLADVTHISKKADWLVEIIEV